MAEKKIIAVVGATGNQGGGLVRAILGDSSGSFAVRALTRDPDSEKAQELAKLGAEVVQADLDSAPTVRAAALAVGTHWMRASSSSRLYQEAVQVEEDALLPTRAAAADGLVSGIVAGKALRGPADRMMASLGEEATALGVARHYAATGLLDAMVIDEQDRSLAGAVAALGVEVVVADTIMGDTSARARLAGEVLAIAQGRA